MELTLNELRRQLKEQGAALRPELSSCASILHSHLEAAALDLTFKRYESANDELDLSTSELTKLRILLGY